MSRRKKVVLENQLVSTYAAEGKCIIKHNEKVIFLTGAVPGDVVDVVLLKNKKDWAEGLVLKHISYSADRVEPFCEHFGVCGGCKWQMLPYTLQAQFKQQQVFDQLTRIGQVRDANYLPIAQAAADRLYRNKVEFTFSTKRYLTREQLNNEAFSADTPVVGYHAPQFFDKVIDIETCHLQAEPANAIRNALRTFALSNGVSFYDLREHTGTLRLMMVRTTVLGETLVNLQFGACAQQEIDMVMEFLASNFPEINSLYYTINTKRNDTIYDLEPVLYKGKPQIQEALGKYVFNISPKSFFQTNTKQAEVLYGIAKDFAQLTGTETLYDLYCGTGSIGIFCSDAAAKIIGVESIADAVEDAKVNAANNNVANANFFAGDVINICTDEFFATHGRPDVIITDPPRAGMHPDLVETLLRIAAPRIVYVSCNPATQARDLQKLQQKYTVVKVQAVDMFPQTHHVESVALLEVRGDL
ncbi:MAG: rRNA ((1939)-C(5))-methyltransferase RlmD [Bacteroidota bacterium]|jgi:23S rRNA (uracil1939-C5)-methyltransferase